jgi:hypothetical protein
LPALKIPIDSLAVASLEAPVLAAYERRHHGSVRWLIWCRYCDGWHSHSQGEGHRETRCNETTPCAETLRQTGIPHVFVLGTPMIPRTDEYADGGPKWEADMERLRAIVTEYRSRLEAGQNAEETRIGSESKVAQVIYSTG